MSNWERTTELTYECHPAPLLAAYVSPCGELWGAKVWFGNPRKAKGVSRKFKTFSEATDWASAKMGLS